MRPRRRWHRLAHKVALYCAFALVIAAGEALARTRVELAGSRLIEDGSTCAGWLFKVDNTAARYDEMACRHRDYPTLQTRVQWLNAEQFILVETNLSSSAPGRPPRVWMYTVESLSANRVHLREAWTGWSPGRDSVSAFRRK
jgi:hypothetical protein